MRVRDKMSEGQNFENEGFALKTCGISPRNTKKGGGLSQSQMKFGRARAFCFTWNNYTKKDLENIGNWLDQLCIEFDINEEEGKEGTVHLQGYMYFKNQRSWSSIKKKWPCIHLEIAKNKFAARNYCRKSDTKIGEGRHKENMNNLWVCDNVPDELRDWQIEVMKEVERPADARQILWVRGKPGCGKTSMLKYLIEKSDLNVVLVAGACKDVKCQIAEMKENCQEPPKVICWNLPYAQRNNLSYMALEAVKDGLFASSKYKGGMIRYPSPVVIVFTNFLPDFDKIPESADRYKVWDLEDDSDDE